MLANGGCEHGQLGQSEYLMEVCNAWTSRPQLSCGQRSAGKALGCRVPLFDHKFDFGLESSVKRFYLT